MASRPAPVVPARPQAIPGPAWLSERDAALLATRRVGHLASASAAGEPHVVPVCFAFDGESIFIALDAKPKTVSVRRLKRVRNILANPAVAFLVDLYDDDWSRLHFVLIQGRAELIEPGDARHAGALDLLRARYPQYREMPLEAHPIIAVAAVSASSWHGGDTGGDDPPSREHLDMAAIIRGRRSVRVYQELPVSRELLARVLEAARWAPSPHGRQPWRFAVLTRPEIKQRLAEAMGDEWRRNLAMDGQDDATIAIRLDKSYQRVLKAPAIIIPCLYLEELDVYPDPVRREAEKTMAIQSLGAAAQNMLLAAYSLGLDAGWMCAPLFCPEVVVGALGLDPALVPHALLTLGYAAADPKRRERKPLDELIVLYD